MFIEKSCSWERDTHQIYVYMYRQLKNIMPSATQLLPSWKHKILISPAQTPQRWWGLYSWSVTIRSMFKPIWKASGKNAFNLVQNIWKPAGWSFFRFLQVLRVQSVEICHVLLSEEEFINTLLHSSDVLKSTSRRRKWLTLWRKSNESVNGTPLYGKST